LLVSLMDAIKWIAVALSTIHLVYITRISTATSRQYDGYRRRKLFRQQPEALDAYASPLGVGHHSTGAESL